LTLLTFSGCRHYSNNPSPAPAIPAVLVFNTYPYGVGDGSNQLEFDLYTNYSYYAGYQYYEINVAGFGVYDYPPGSYSLYFNNLAPGSYPFTVHVGCLNGYNNGCVDQYINGTANVYYNTNTVVSISPR